MSSFLLWLIPSVCLLACLVTAAGQKLLGSRSHWPCVGAFAIAMVSSLLLVMLTGAEGSISTGYTWINAGNVHVNLVLRADALTTLMLVAVTSVSLLVAIYSAGYMHGDPGYPRFFAVVALFVFSMTMLVESSNFLLLYVFWEAVGLCSYLLIGFWFQKPEAARAGQKAFVVNRIGDFGFALGIFLLWVLVGDALNWTPPAGGQLLDDDVVFGVAGKIAQQSPGALTAACLLLLMGAIGKSAQFPLHVWLPDAMEGPTPVSALIHAATMVTAGVYMLARCSPLLVHAPVAQLVIAVVGGVTALMAAIIAVTQTDLKRILAYSTVSQLGYMFMALGSCAGAPGMQTLAVVAAIFHLFTHAFFKALLFLGAGSVMHAMGNVIDVRRFSGLRTVLPVTHWTFLCGVLALSGLPVFSGFWSKDEVVAMLVHGTHGPFPAVFAILVNVALLTGFLTSFYSFRAYFLTFWGPRKIPAEAGHHAHESPANMLWPLRLLAVAALFAGLVFGPSHLVSHHLATTPGLLPPEPHHANPAVLAAGSLMAIAGLVSAAVFYVWRPGLATLWAFAIRPLYELSRNKFYIDEVYDRWIVQPILGLARFGLAWDKRDLDALVDAIGRLPGQVGSVLRPIQNGQIQWYAWVMFAGVAFLVLTASVGP